MKDEVNIFHRAYARSSLALSLSRTLSLALLLCALAHSHTHSLKAVEFYSSVLVFHNAAAYTGRVRIAVVAMNVCMHFSSSSPPPPWTREHKEHRYRCRRRDHAMETVWRKLVRRLQRVNGEKAHRLQTVRCVVSTVLPTISSRNEHGFRCLLRYSIDAKSTCK